MFREMRRKHQAQTEEVCTEILKTERRGVLSVLGEDGYPYGIPLNFYYDTEERIIYFHCARVGHKLDAIAENSKVCFTTWNTGYQTPGDWAWNVTSVVCFCRAEPVQDTERTHRKIWAMATKYSPDLEEARDDFNRNINRTQLVALHIEHMSGKLVNEK